MKERKLKYMPYAQAAVQERSNGDVYLRSYKTIVAGIVGGKLYCYGTYSATTRRHLGAFAKEYGLTYQDLKRLYEDDLCMDMATGELMAA